MRTSTIGTICFGVLCDDSAVFPWENNVNEGDIEEWWFTQGEFKDIYEPFTRDGNYAPGWSHSDSRFDAYFDHRRQWLQENPIPVTLENYCSHSDPMLAITVPELSLRCRGGYPQSFDPASLVVTSEQIQDLVSFLERYNIRYDGSPRWLLLNSWA